MTTGSALYSGWVRHRRFAPSPHAFRYRLFLVYLDLDELDRVFEGRWLWSTRRPAIARFRRMDHFGDPGQPLAESVREFVRARTGTAPAGPIRLLTHLAYFGYCFNPVSFFYLFREDGETIDAVVAEVANTPWGERHLYLLDASIDRGSGRTRRYRNRKEFHVSPFLPMEMDYTWVVTDPAARLAVHVENRAANVKVFDATMLLERREITSGSLALALAAFPAMTARVIAAIHWQALRLWLKRISFVPHPKHARPPAGGRGAEAPR